MSEKTYKGLYRSDTLRNPKHDYTRTCWYMITINTFGHKHYFGTLAETDNRPSLLTTKIGDYAKQCWEDIPKHYPQVLLDDFVLMPDHIHGLLKFTPSSDLLPNHFGVQSRNLGSAIRAFKSTVKRYANQNEIEFLWQSGYHDRIIHTEEVLYHCKNYIQQNPSKLERSN